MLTYRSQAEEAKSVVAEIEAMGRKAVALKLDVGDISGFAAFVDTVRSTLQSAWSSATFNHLVNNAGHGQRARAKR
nr:SDR family NAD(P)-dependent oxidoreductase [Cohnella sp. OV330]